jgi:putative hemolysin
MTSFLNVLWILVLIALSGLFSGYETGGYLLNRIRLRSRSKSHEQAAIKLRKVLADAYLFIFTVLIANNITIYLISRSMTQIYLKAGVAEHHQPVFGFIPWNAETAATLTLMLPLFLFAELIPKNIFRRSAETLMYHLSGPLLFLWRMFLPVTVPLKAFFNLLTAGRGDSDALNGFSLSLQGLHEYFTEETRRTALSDHQHIMIGNLVAMHRVPVRQVMQPSGEVAAVSFNTTVESALALMQARHIEQLAVYKRSSRNIVGIINLFDLMDPAVNPSAPIHSCLQKIVRISADLPLTRAFRRLRQTPSMPVAVTDRARRTVGLLHLQDIARYITRDA